MRLNTNLFWRFACAATMAAMTATAQQTPTIIPLTSAGNIGAAPNGISSTSGELLFTQRLTGLEAAVENSVAQPVDYIVGQTALHGRRQRER